MDLTKFRDALTKAVQEHGGLAASGQVEGTPSAVVRVATDDPAVWADLVVNAKPPIFWISESGTAFPEYD